MSSDDESTDSRIIAPAEEVVVAAQSPLAGVKRYRKPELVHSRAVKRSRTTILLDSGVPATVTRNIILPLATLVRFLEDNFCCRHCRTVFKTRVTDEPPGTDENYQDPHKVLQVEIFGLACGINFNCQCGTAASLRPTLVPSASSKIKSLKDGKPYATRVNAGDFEINRRFILGLQLCGDGRHDAKNIAGLLNLNVNPMKQQWTNTQESIGLAIIKVASEILEENLVIECELSPMGEDNRKAVDACSDNRWDKQGSMRRYNSQSGTSVFMGLRSKLPIGLECMSSVCIKCTKGKAHDPSICPKNYDGTAKGMEAVGAVKILIRIFENKNVRCYIDKLVTDDDSSVRKKSTHSYRELIDAGRMTEAEWPRYDGAGRAKKPDTGVLPIGMPALTFLADKGHRNRSYSSKNFAEAAKSKKAGCGMTKVDAERMKRRMSYTLRLHTGGTYEEFKKAMTAVLQHHFNDHSFCGDWCPARDKPADGFRFRCKERNKDMYEFMSKNHEIFMEEDKLKQLFHMYDTQNVEGFNKLITKFLPKDKTYCQTIENKVRVHLAAGIQSVGYDNFYKRVFELTGIKGVEDDMTTLFFGSEDSGKLFRQSYRRKKSVKIKRMKNQFQRIREGVAKLRKDNANALTYESGMMAPGAREEVQQAGRVVGCCKHCGSTTHSRSSSKDCPENPKNKLAAQKSKSDETQQGK
jgi:hypothetical protein